MKKFYDLLLKFSQENDLAGRREIEAFIWDEFGCERAVLVLDMSGFSRLSLRHGVVHYLSMVRRMQLTVEPIIESNNGRIIKFEADNAFATFSEPADAVRSAIACNFALDAANILTPDELDIRISCGIDYGEILVVNNADFFGNAVNRASKLGEDIAQAGEILITDEVLARLPKDAKLRCQDLSFSISGIEIKGGSIFYRRSPNDKEVDNV